MKAHLKSLRNIGISCLAVLCIAGQMSGLASAQTGSDPANRALAWMKTQQQPDGSFAGFGVGSTVDALLAILAAGQDPATYSQGGNTPVSYLESKVGDLAKSPGSAGKMILAVVQLSRAGKSFNGTKQLIQALNTSYDVQAGRYGKDAIGHAFGMLGAATLGDVPSDAVTYLKSIQTAEGGWAFSGDTAAGAADTNTTAVAIQALVAAGEPENSPVIKKALDYLATQQNSDGGYPYQKEGEFGGESDVNSSAYVMQALLTVGADSQKVRDYLTSMQKSNGAFQWKKSEPDDNAGATYQAIPALLGTVLWSPITIAVPGDNPGEVPPVVGMPSTGSTDGFPLDIVAALAATATVAGLLARRKIEVR